MSYSALYPSTIPDATYMFDETDNVDWVDAADFYGLRNELHAVMRELGTLPKGDFETVKARLDAGGAPDYIKVSDTKAQNTWGGTFTQGDWRTRVINTEDADTGGHCSISSNQITLAAGTYECEIFCPAYATNRHQARLYNITDNEVTVVGTSAKSPPSAYGQASSFIRGRFTIAAEKTFEIQHIAEFTFVDYGFGVPGNFAAEVYTVAVFHKAT